MSIRINPEVELKVRLAVLLKLADASGKVINTPTYRDLAVTVAEFLMEPSNHARFLKINQDVAKELSLAKPPVDGVPDSIVTAE